MRPLISRLYTVSCFLGLVWISAFALGQGKLDPRTAPPKYEIPRLKYPTADMPVISYNLMDFAGADNTGKRDMAPLIQALLNRLGSVESRTGGVGNGGTLFLPEGKYLLKSNLIVPKCVTLRGEWQKPEKGQPIVGTLLVSDFGRGDEAREKSLLILQPGAAAADLAFWYPRQDAEKIMPYPPSLGLGAPGYFGNDYPTARNITFVNSYSGAELTFDGGGPVLQEMYGTPLKRGIEIDFIAEIGRIETVDFSPDYWIGSGLPNAPKAETLKKWLRSNGTAVVMRRNDWTYASDIRAEGYAVGFQLTRTKKENENTFPNGQNARLYFKDCRVAILAEIISYAGVMFHDVVIDQCDWGLFVPENADGILQATQWNVNANQYAISTDINQSVKLHFAQSQFSNGKIELYGGTAVFIDSDFEAVNPQLKIGAESRVLMAGNRFSKKVGIVNRSLYECVFSAAPIADLKKIPDVPYKNPALMRQKPPREALYVATEHGIKPNDPSFDNTMPLQQLFDQAAQDGGGVVYLPPGKYRCLGHLTVPSGVELKGAVDTGMVPLGSGSALEIYEGKGKPDAPPFLTLQEGSGLRGIVFNYPEQIFDSLRAGQGDQESLNPHIYPYAIRVTGKDVYLVNLGFRATSQALDLFTHKADNVYLEFPAGHVFLSAIRVGGGTDNATIRNAQFNTISYAFGHESKFGYWDNATKQKDSNAAYRQNWRDLQFMILEDCSRLFLFNNFHYGSHVGLQLGSQRGAPSGISLGLGVDSSTQSVVCENVGQQGFDFIGSQIVSTQQNIEGGQDAKYIVTKPTFSGEVNFFSADFWGYTLAGVQLGGGHVYLLLSHFNFVGHNGFVETNSQTNGLLRVLGSNIPIANNLPPIDEKKAANLRADYSVITAGSLGANALGSFQGNLSSTATLSHKNTLDRKGWVALASQNHGVENMLDGKKETRWNTGKGMAKGDWIALDLKNAGSYNTLFLDQGTSPGDYPLEYDVFVSNNGKQWGRPLTTGQGTRDVTVIHFSEPQEKRYVKIAIKTPRSEPGLYWSVAEIHAALLRHERAVSPF